MGAEIGYKGVRCKKKCKPKTVLKLGTFQKLQKFRKIGPRCDFEPKRGKRLELGWWTFGSRGPRGRPKEGDGRKKEEPRKKE